MPRSRMIRRSRSAGLCSLAILLPCFTAAMYPQAGRAQPLALPAFTVMAHRCGSSVATLTLAAVARTESRFEPLVVGDNSTHRAYAAQNLEEAASTAQRLIAAGDNIDLGLMQINSNSLRRLRLTVREALDPCSSIAAGASILTQNYLAAHGAPDAQTALRNAISMYNTGNALRGYRNGYVSRVEAAAALLAPLMAVSDAPVAGLVPAPLAVASWDVWQTAPRSQASPAIAADPAQIFAS